jgi:hypothetical protein
VIGKCQPDVILVEKAVSCNVNEYIQKHGVTVVSEMNIHRLERIARCIGSPIISLQDVLAKPNLIKQCESLRFEKFVQEHNIAGEDGRKSCKTFLFLEGFPKPLGCTVCLFLLYFCICNVFHLCTVCAFFTTLLMSFLFYLLVLLLLFLILCHYFVDIAERSNKRRT